MAFSRGTKGMIVRAGMLVSVMLTGLAFCVVDRCFAVAPAVVDSATNQVPSVRILDSVSTNRVPAPQKEYAAIARKVTRMLPSSHLQQKPFDDVVSQRAWTNLLAAYDFDRTYFTQDDVRRFERMRLKIDDALGLGDVDFGYEVYAVFRERVEQRYVFATNALSRPVDFTMNESLEWKRKDMPWPASDAERLELWRLRLKNEYLAYILGKEIEQEDAAAKLRTDAAKLRTDATNGVVAATNGSSPAVVGSVTNEPPLTPEAFIAKRYKQFMILIQDMDEETIFQRYISAACTAYDPHTDYLSPMKLEDFDMDMNLSLCGIGAQLRSEDGVAKIMEIIAGGPADRDKRDIRLVPGDKIIGVGQGDGPVEDIIHMSLGKAVRKIRGAKGTKVVLSVIPAADPSGSTLKRVDLIRDEIKLEEQAATGRVERVTMADGRERKMGYIRVPAFYASRNQNPNDEGFRSVTLDVARKLAELNNEQVEGLILDLRDNGGGLLPEALSLTGLFVRSGPAVQVREPHRMLVLPVPNFDPAVAFRKPVVVLVNRASASASEIVAGALQDYGRAVVLGDTQTHGKGTVQTVMGLGKETYGSLKVTTSSFYRITGASTQIKGVRSDIVIPSMLDGMDIGEDTLPNALPWSKMDRASFIEVADVAKLVPELRRRSAERLTGDDRYLRHCRLVRHIREVSERTQLPLEINARRTMIRAEDEMRKLGADAEDGEAESTAKKAKADDIVLTEAARILADLSDLSGGKELPMETEGDLKSRMLRIFGKQL